MNKEIKTDKTTGEVVIKDGNYSFKQFGIYPDIIQLIEDLQQENKQLKDNWNKLKKIAKSQSDFKLKCHNESVWFEVDELLDKMQELENGDTNE